MDGASATTQPVTHEGREVIGNTEGEKGRRASNKRNVDRSDTDGKKELTTTIEKEETGNGARLNSLEW